MRDGRKTMLRASLATAFALLAAGWPAEAGAFDACPSVPEEAKRVPVTLPAACTLPFDAVAYSATAHDSLMAEIEAAATTIDTQAATIRRLVKAIENTPPPVSRAEWFGIGAAAGAAIGLAIWGVSASL